MLSVHGLKSKLLLGVYEKRKDDNQLKQRIISYFKAPPFRILHLSDLHYVEIAIKEGKSYEEQMALFEALIEKVYNEHRNSPFDCIFMTGDFVGSNPDKDFIGVKESVMEIIEKTITMENVDRLFIVPGNHDMMWEDYENKVLSDISMRPYLEFYRDLYANRLNVMSELPLWDKKRKTIFDYKNIKKIVWNRRLMDPNISVIGLPTPSMNKRYQGKGEFLKVDESFISSCWGGIDVTEK
jgi:predicted MPP superfamily phosphohydrolase